MEDSESLDVSALGEPSEIIVLRDIDLGPEAEFEMEELQDDKRADALQSKDIQSSIEAEQVSAQQEEVNKEIDKLNRFSFRSGSPARVITKLEYDDLLQTIIDGYKGSQLTHYLKLHSPSKNGQRKKFGRSLKTGEDAKNEHCPVISAWSPGIITLETRLPMFTSGSEFLRGKRRLADAVIRRCWEIETEDELDAIGQIEIILTPGELSLLLVGGMSLLSKILGLV